MDSKDQDEARPAKMIFIGLWNGEGGGGPGRTKHLMEEARKNSAPVYRLDIRISEGAIPCRHDRCVS